MKIVKKEVVNIELDAIDSIELLKAASAYNEHEWHNKTAFAGGTILDCMTALVNRAFEQGRHYERNH